MSAFMLWSTGCLMLCGSVGISWAQNYENIDWTEQLDPAGFIYDVPSDWIKEDHPSFSAVFVAPDNAAYCTLKRTSNQAYAVITAEMYVADRLGDPSAIANMLPIQYPDGSGQLLSIQEFPFEQSPGILISSKGNMYGANVVSSVFQTVQINSLVTLACFGRSDSFGFYFPIFAKMAASFDFSGHAE